MNNYRIGVCLMTGGKSSRMGKNKATLIYRGVKMYEYLAEEFSKLAIPKFISVSKMHQYECKDFISIPDKYDEIGPIGGISSVLEYISLLDSNHPAKCDAVLFSAVDMPYFNSIESKAIIERYTGEDVLMVYSNSQFQPLNSIYSTSALILIHDLIQNRQYKLSNIASSSLHTAKYETRNPECYVNINTRKEASNIPDFSI